MNNLHTVHEVRAGSFGYQTPPFRAAFGRSWCLYAMGCELDTFLVWHRHFFLFFIFSLLFSSSAPPPSKFHIKPFSFFFLHIWSMSFLPLFFLFWISYKITNVSFPSIMSFNVSFLNDWTSRFFLHSISGMMTQVTNLKT